MVCNFVTFRILCVVMQFLVCSISVAVSVSFIIGYLFGHQAGAAEWIELQSQASRAWSKCMDRVTDLEEDLRLVHGSPF